MFFFLFCVCVRACCCCCCWLYFGRIFLIWKCTRVFGMVSPHTQLIAYMQYSCSTQFWLLKTFHCPQQQILQFSTAENRFFSLLLFDFFRILFFHGTSCKYVSCTNNRSRMFFFFLSSSSSSFTNSIYTYWIFVEHFLPVHTRKNVFRVIGKRVNAKKQHFLCTFSVLFHVCALSMSYQNICPISLVFVMRCLEDIHFCSFLSFSGISPFFVCSKKPNGAFYFNFWRELSAFFCTLYINICA